MARMRLQQAAVLDHIKRKVGQTVADTPGNAQAGDIVWTSLSAATWAPYMIALDASATTMMNASRFANTPAPRPDGVTSVEG
jgi:hypothetical protein